MSITLDDVHAGVIEGLEDRFPSIAVYGETLPEEVEPPYLVVVLTSVSMTKISGRRHVRSHLFEISYNAGSNGDERAVAEQLFDALSYIEVSGAIFRGSGMKHETKDGKLVFTVNYNFHVLEQKPPATAMQSMDQEVTTR